jgi:small GTP-binding protein
MDSNDLEKERGITITAKNTAIRWNDYRINIVDTPGTNAIIRRHQEITEEFVPRADLILFVTSADRPFSESERLFLQRIREWGKKIVFVVNKADRPGADRLRQELEVALELYVGERDDACTYCKIATKPLKSVRQEGREVIWCDRRGNEIKAISVLRFH